MLLVRRRNRHHIRDAHDHSQLSPQPTARRPRGHRRTVLGSQPVSCPNSTSFHFCRAACRDRWLATDHPIERLGPSKSRSVGPNAQRREVHTSICKSHHSRSSDARGHCLGAKPPDRSTACAWRDPRWATRDRPDIAKGAYRTYSNRPPKVAARKRCPRSLEQREHLCHPEPSRCTGSST